MDGSVLKVKDDLNNNCLRLLHQLHRERHPIQEKAAGRAFHDFKNIWKPAISDNVKRALFWASKEPIPLCGPEAWTLISEQESYLDG